MSETATVGRRRLPELTDLWLGSVAGLQASEFFAPTTLPGWDRRHLVAHVGFNALALTRLVAWASTGIAQPMYASADQREREIERGAMWDADALLALTDSASCGLRTAFDRLTPQQWAHEVVTAQGRTLAAAELPWLRARELAIHTVDLNVAVTFRDLPDGFCAVLVGDVCAQRSKRAGERSLALTDGRAEWHIHGSGDPTTVRADVAVLAQWVTGRDSGQLVDWRGGPLPGIGPWI